ncbi:hypothetical protein RDI58_020388 [Solanum bulbocastanum]|uniref:Uncharacterized protein n=1 Tax=Solanum bulbocastanum TaxID=147425 RepID=A0AAN8Y7U8_SOLBU
MIEENIMKQKSRAKWIKLRDSNTKYFSAVMKERSQQKQITQLTSLEGIQLSDQGAIREEVVKFYKGLIGSSSKKSTSNQYKSDEERGSDVSRAKSSSV